MARILVVDDEKGIVKGLRFNLENEGYEVDAGYNGREAVEMARANDYDLIVESTVTAFAKKSLNVTDDLLREMGVDPKNAKGKEKGKDEGK